jgi:acetyl-CoA carboxylase carboxyltransferase component
MSRVFLHPTGHERDQLLDDASYEANLEAMASAEERVLRARDDVRDGWGERYRQRVHAKGKMTTWERIDALKDGDSPFLPVNTLANYGLEFGPRKLKSPGAGVVTGFARVHGRWVVVIANDNTVASGSWWPKTPEKIERAQEMARRLGVPVLYLVDCSGLFLPEQSRSFPGATGAGHIFKKNSLLAADGVPQIAGVFGDCIAGGGYMPIISDRVIMTEQAYMVIAGAALIKGAKSQHITSLDIGGPEIHVHISGCADERVPDDATCIEAMRREVARLPTSAVAFYRAGTEPADPRFDPAELRGIVPSDHRHSYATEELIARLVDRGMFWELMADVGTEVIVGIGRVRGLYVGFLANNVEIVEHPDRPGEMRPGGILYQQGIAKLAAFSRACNADGIPMVWLQDVSGFDIGSEAEKHGLLAYGSSLIYANSTNDVPMFTVLLRKASGAGYYAMAGLPYDPVLQLITPVTRLSVMEGRTLAIGTYATQLDDDWNVATEDPEEAEKVRRGMAQVEARIEADMNPLVAGRQMDADEVVLLSELRSYLEAAAEMAYQSTARRRTKNPRIWSLHDLAVLRGE